MSINVKFRVWIEVEGAHLIGPGGYEILKAIDEVGSLSGAARKLGMSYRFVWNYINKMEKNFGVKLVDPWKGGKGKGGAKLTPDGRALLKYYEDIVTEMNKVASEWSMKLNMEFQSIKNNKKT